jgi:hypothetical protein
MPGRWFKGSLHIHSTASDGRLTPEEVITWYRGHGYHFLALTDHDVLGRSGATDSSFLALRGIEIQGIDPTSGLYHLVGLGTERIPDLTGGRDGLPLQEAIHRLRAAGGLVVLAHPYWSGQMSKDLLSLEGCTALEIYNGGCEVLDCKGLSTVHWDDLLAAGKRLWGLAVDDAHWRPGPLDAGLGWVWVKAATLTQAAILHALEQGHFYATSGPRIEDVRIDGDWVHMRCSPAVTVDFIGDGRHSSRLQATSGETFTEATQRLRKRQRYVRVACQDAHGAWAWSNPCFLNALEDT